MKCPVGAICVGLFFCFTGFKYISCIFLLEVLPNTRRKPLWQKLPKILKSYTKFQKMNFWDDCMHLLVFCGIAHGQRSYGPLKMHANRGENWLSQFFCNFHNFPQTFQILSIDFINTFSQFSTVKKSERYQRTDPFDVLETHVRVSWSQDVIAGS